MILGKISYLDCIVFLLFLAPQLIIHVGFFTTAKYGLKALPFLVVLMPYQLIRERCFVKKTNRSPFVQDASWFQDIVIRCVRYAFANLPMSIGRVFFSKGVALPFLRFRMLRHGYLQSPVYWREVHASNNTMNGLWIIHDSTRMPDIVIYFCHGGGFAMGSSYFYIEFLIAWVELLNAAGYSNPALFALDYTLVPDAVYPTQLQQTVAGYDFVLSRIDDPSRVCIAGDSAGATLQLSLLLILADHPDYLQKPPGFGVMISPWVTLVSDQNLDTSSDYLNANTLHQYARQYAGKSVSVNNAIVSPGNCKSLDLWQRATPKRGFHFLYGAEEVFAPETRDFIDLLRDAKMDVDSVEQKGGIHAWPVTALYLSDTRMERTKGLKSIVSAMRQKM